MVKTMTIPMTYLTFLKQFSSNSDNVIYINDVCFTGSTDNVWFDYDNTFVYVTIEKEPIADVKHENIQSIKIVQMPLNEDIEIDESDYENFPSLKIFKDEDGQWDNVLTIGDEKYQFIY